MRVLAALLIALAPTPLAAQIRPQPGPGDPRVQTVEYSPDQVVQLQGAPGYQITVALNPDERVESVALGDSGSWQVTANKRGDHLFVKPVNPGVATNMVVLTDLRMYTFELVPAQGRPDNLAFAVRFVYPAAATATTETSPTPPTVGRYMLGGDRLLRPSAMSDDGTHTQIEWPATAPLPAIYAIGVDGRETLVSGNVRSGRIVVDSIAPKFIFREDRRVATAVRIAPGKRR